MIFMKIRIELFFINRTFLLLLFYLFSRIGDLYKGYNFEDIYYYLDIKFIRVLFVI